MCTAISMNTKDHYFGRNLDLDHSYNEEVCVMPRNFALNFIKAEKINTHYAIMGMATIIKETPLFYDGVNEHGLSMAGLNFPENAHYFPPQNGMDNITPFEFIPWILGQCKTVDEAMVLLNRINLVDIPFSESLPLTPLHWMIADKNKSIVIEPQKDGLKIHNNPVGVLTNNPPFEYQLKNLEKYIDLRNDNSKVQFPTDLPYSTYSTGLGGVGLPGDVSSMSRFVRAEFYLRNSVCNDDENSSVNQFFHLLSSVEVVRGVSKTDDGNLNITIYSACMNTTRGKYYYTTYDNRQITCIDMHKTDLESNKISRFKI